MLADIANGHVDAADVLFLIAVILFAVGAFLAFRVEAIWACVIAAGLACCATGWLVL